MNSRRSTHTHIYASTHACIHTPRLGLCHMDGHMLMIAATSSSDQVRLKITPFSPSQHPPPTPDKHAAAGPVSTADHAKQSDRALTSTDCNGMQLPYTACLLPVAQLQLLLAFPATTAFQQQCPKPLTNITGNSQLCAADSVLLTPFPAALGTANTTTTATGSRCTLPANTLHTQPLLLLLPVAAGAAYRHLDTWTHPSPSNLPLCRT